MPDVVNSWKFSQGSFKKALKSSALTENGICEGLVSSWMVYHSDSNGGNSLQKSLTINGSIDETKFALSCQRFAATYSKEMLNPKEDKKRKLTQTMQLMNPSEQKSATKSMMEYKGFKHVGYAWGIEKYTKSSVSAGVDKLLEEMMKVTGGSSLSGSQLYYMFVRLATPSAGHATGLRMNKFGSGSFFDPNTGQWDFDSAVKFREWFKSYLGKHRTWKNTNWLQGSVYMK